MLRVYWLVKLPVGNAPGFRRGLNPTPMVLTPVFRVNERGLLKLTAVLLSAQVASIDRPANVVADTPVLPLMGSWVGTKVAVT